MYEDQKQHYAKKQQTPFQQPSLLDWQIVSAAGETEEAGEADRERESEPVQAVSEEELAALMQQQLNEAVAQASQQMADALAREAQGELDAADAEEDASSRETSIEDEQAVIVMESTLNELSGPDELELGPLPAVPLALVLNCLAENELGDARLFAYLFAGRCLRDVTAFASLAGWHFWREHYWEENENGSIRLLVSGTLASVYQKASILVNSQLERDRKRGVSPEKRREREAQLKLLAGRVEALKASKRTDNMLNYANTLLSANASKWDAHPWLLGTRQGVIDLRTGTLRAGQPEDYLRTVIPTVWKGLDEPAPRFEQFLREIFSDREEAEREELIAFLQRVLGYGITGHVSEHVFLMLYGEEGRNGKDTLMYVLEQVLGKVVGAVSEDVLISRGRASAPGAARPHLCSLQGKRIAWVSESSRDARFAIEQLKQLTGGGAIVARQLYAREYTFAPTHLLVLLTNYRPEADPADSAFWERLCPIVFNVRFVEKPERANERQRDPELARTLAGEASGILAWLVRGALAWQRLGLAIPESVRKARQDYRRSESSVMDFISQCCILDPESRTPAHQLYKRYKRWASENDFELISNKQFGRELKQYNAIIWMRHRNGNVYRGIRLQGEETAE